MNFFHEIGVNSEDAENFGQQGVGVLLDMSSECRKFIQKQLKLLLGHRLYNEFPIVREKEEGATASSSLASFEHHVAVELGTKR